VDPDRHSRELGARTGISSWASLEEALSVSGARAVIIASPPTDHEEQSISCLRAGLAVLVEKPQALSLAGAARAVAVARETGRPLLVGQNFRFLGRERAVRKALTDGAIGQVGRVVAISARPASVMSAHTRELPLAPLWDVGIHHLDAVRTRFHDLPDAIRAETSGGPADPWESLVVTLTWADGKRVEYQHGERSPSFHYYEWIEGTTGTLEVNGNSVVSRTRGGRRRTVRTPRGREPEHVLLAALVDALSGSTGPGDGDAEENLRTMAIIEAVIRSAANGGRIRVRDVYEEAGLPVPASNDG
jgi:predicted dehydrogenase